MDKEKFDKIVEYLDLLKKDNISTYNLKSVTLFDWCYGSGISGMFNEEQKKKLEDNKIHIINDFEWLNLKIVVDENDLMLFIIFTTLSNRTLAEFSKWEIADFLMDTTYTSGDLDKEAIEEIIEEINELDLS